MSAHAGRSRFAPGASVRGSPAAHAASSVRAPAGSPAAIASRAVSSAGTRTGAAQPKYGRASTTARLSRADPPRLSRAAER